MRYTDGIRLKTSQWGKMAELQIDSVALQRDILARQNGNDSTTMGRRERDRRLLVVLDNRWESSREADADQNEKPLIGYEEWGVIETRYTEGERNRSHIEEPMTEENMEIWAKT